MTTQGETTVEELESGWRKLSEGERGIATVLLSRARALVVDAYEASQIAFSSLSGNKLEIVKIVECDMVRNAFVNARLGSTSLFAEDTESPLWEQPDAAGWLRLTDEHYRQLGIAGGAWSIHAKADYKWRA